MHTGKTSQRIQSIDLTRGLAVLFMIAVHTLEVFGSSSLRSSWGGEMIEFLGGPPAAPVFMTLMGLSMAISGKNNTKAQVRRGISVWLTGYLLNLLRAVLPLQIVAFTGTNSANGIPLDWMDLLTVIDILQFAGLAMIITATTQHFSVGKYTDLVISLAVLLLAPLLWGITTTEPASAHLLNLLWGDAPLDHPFLTNRVAFPVFPWLSFPYLGLFLGKLLHEGQDLNTTFRKIGSGGMVVMLAGLAISWGDMDHQFNDYYHSRPGAMIFMAGFVAAWIALIHWVTEKTPWNRAYELLTQWSRSVTYIYMAQWILILWVYIFLGREVQSMQVMLLLIGIFTWLSHKIGRYTKQVLD